MRRCKLGGRDIPADRMLGTSTAQALRIIAGCIERPGAMHTVRDHHGTPGADRNLHMLIGALVDKLGLDHFKYSRSGEFCYVKCDLMEPL